MHVELRWTPQRVVWGGFVVSLLGVGACVAIVAVTWRRRRGEALAAADLAAAPQWVSPLAERHAAALQWGTTVLLAAGVFALSLVFARPSTALLAGVATVVAARVPAARVAIYVAIPVLVGLSRALDRPELAWAALALFVVGLAVQWPRAQRTE
jgi:hypothetical protein